MKQPQNYELALVSKDISDDPCFPSEQVKEFLYCISKSFSVKHACSMSGLGYNTVLDWLNPNCPRYKQGLHKLFERAQASCFASHIKAVHDSKDWKAHAFWLERHEKDYAPRDKSASVINNIGINTSPERIQLTPDMLKSLSQAYDDMKKESQSPGQRSSTDERLF
jgi:hypothetical protein